MKNQILFIDDEQNLLSGLKRLLRPQKEIWDMEFVLGGRAALEKVHQHCFDVVVTDMKMPELDGAQVLEEVKKICPFSVRMILSGQASESAIFRALECSHQYMSKPCKNQTLEGRIIKACNARELLPNLELKEFVTGLDSIPTLPKSLMNLSSHDLQENAQIFPNLISHDVGMSAKVLQLVNSDYFGKGKTCANIIEACNILGPDIVLSLIEETNIFQPVILESDSLHFLNLTAHSYQVAQTAQNIAALEGFSEQQQQEAFTAGLLHEIGRIVLASHKKHEYQQVIALVQNEHISHQEAETQIFGASHSEIGAYLSALWGLSDDVVEAITHQNAPMKSTHSDFRLLSVLHAANALEDELRPFRIDETKVFLNEEYLKNIDKESRVQDWRNLVLQQKEQK